MRAIDEILLANAVSAFRVRGEAGAREMLQGWHEGQGPEKILIITGDEQSDLLGRKVDAKRIEKAREYALENPDSKSVHLEYGRWGEEYLFFIRNWGQHGNPASSESAVYPRPAFGADVA